MATKKSTPEDQEQPVEQPVSDLEALKAEAEANGAKASYMPDGALRVDY